MPEVHDQQTLDISMNMNMIKKLFFPEGPSAPELFSRLVDVRQRQNHFSERSVPLPSD